MHVDQLYVPHLTRGSSAQAVHAALAAVPGVAQVQVQLANRVIRVTHAETTGVSDLLQALQRIGYTDVAVLV